MTALAYRLFGGPRFVVAATDAQKRVPPEVLFVQKVRLIPHDIARLASEHF
jgi:hypothetical protein